MESVFPAEHLVRQYYYSAGRNANLLIGMAIDERGLVPEKDAEEFRRFGREIKRRFGKALSETSGSGASLELIFPRRRL